MIWLIIVMIRRYVTEMRSKLISCGLIYIYMPVPAFTWHMEPFCQFVLKLIWVRCRSPCINLQYIGQHYTALTAMWKCLARGVANLSPFLIHHTCLFNCTVKEKDSFENISWLNVILALLSRFWWMESLKVPYCTSCHYGITVPKQVFLLVTLSVTKLINTASKFILVARVVVNWKPTGTGSPRPRRKQELKWSSTFLYMSV